MGFSKEKILYLLFLFSLAAKSAAQVGFKCTQNPSSTCNSLVGYKTPNATTLSHLQNFFGVKDFNSLLGANNLPFFTPSKYTVKKDAVVKIPFPCKCSNGTGVSNKKPIYTIQRGDWLDHIARDVFLALVTYQQIVAVNNITDGNKILVGQELQIPLPCSCDDVGGEKVVHYGHVVESGSSLDLIAQEYGTTMTTLMTLNSIAKASSLMAGQVLDVPLKGTESPDDNYASRISLSWSLLRISLPLIMLSVHLN
ncbi:hypothetical protein JCGZ_03079 [Jatropha curcas]|uniref:LysM domain-containing protein n=1 Tax=Jatropha curcas TaxID=180498 RepID=A0A067L0M1_JATCU|nr:lysM domain-containing GPI-anchored protein 2 isoform X1 [Jatropha curcas]KDP42016.1 hypothetical protein JCGZ_03079 [Jatropha curcas]